MVRRVRDEHELRLEDELDERRRGNDELERHANLGGLTAGTTYHYRLVAVSTAGTSRGTDGILQTSSTPVAVTGGASSITSTSATLNGTVNPNGRSTTWYFEYGTSTSYGTKTPAKSAGAERARPRSPRR